MSLCRYQSGKELEPHTSYTRCRDFWKRTVSCSCYLSNQGTRACEFNSCLYLTTYFVLTLIRKCANTRNRYAKLFRTVMQTSSFAFKFYGHFADKDIDKTKISGRLSYLAHNILRNALAFMYIRLNHTIILTIKSSSY